MDVSVMLSLGDGRYLSTRNFNIRVEKVLIDGLEPEDGFTLLLQAIAAYENAESVTTDAADVATAAAAAANAAAGNATRAIADLQAAAAAGEFDGADGADGFSPVAMVTQTASGGATITITDKNGTTTADIVRGAQGEKGDDGDDGVSCTHSWNGTVLSVTSASGTSSADLVGPQGIQGATGPAGTDGTTFTPVSPLSLSNGELSVDLTGYATQSWVSTQIAAAIVGLADLFYAFSGCSDLVTVYVDSTWALSSGASGSGTFYNCTTLVGGNGTAYASGRTSYAYMVIDSANSVGYLTAV